MDVSRALAGALLLAYSATACAAAPTPHVGSASVTSRTQDARTPEQAAIGFDQSLRSNRVSRFDCIPGGQFSWTGSVAHGRPTASAVREGAQWIVTLRYRSDPLNNPRYQVARRDTGYCVLRVLPGRHPSIGPSSPAPYTGSANTSPTPPPAPARPCRLRDLHVSGPLGIDPIMAAGKATYLRLTNTSRAPCTLRGWPTMAVLDAQRRSTPTHIHDADNAGTAPYKVTTVRVEAGSTAAVSFFVRATNTTDCVGPYYLKLALPGQPGTTLIRDDHNYVAMCTNTPNAVTLTPFHNNTGRP